MTAQNVGAMKATLGLDVSRFEIGAQSASRTTRQLSDAMARAFDAAKQAAGGSVRSFDELRASIDPSFAATQKYAAIQRELAGMVESGAASQRAANLVLEQAAAKYMGVETAAEQTARAQRASVAAVDEAARGYAALRSQLDPLYAASRRYEQAQETLAAAVRAGVVSQEQANRVLERAGQQYLGTAQSTASGAGNMGLAFQNASYQIGDFAVQVAAGTDASRALAMQLPQLLGGFGMWGAAAGAVVAVMGALAPVIMSSMGAASKLDDAMKDLGSSASAYRAAVRDAASSTSDLTAEFGANAAQAEKLLYLTQQLAQIDYARQMTATMESIGAAFSGLQDNLRQIGLLQGQLASGMLDASGSALAFSLNVEDLKEEYGLTVVQAGRVNAALEAMRSAKGPGDQAAAAQELAQALLDASAAGADIPDNIMEVARQSAEAARKGLALEASLQGAQTSADGIASTDMARPIAAAAAEAATLADRLGIALGKAQALVQARMADAAMSAPGAPSVRGTGAYAPGAIDFGNPYDGGIKIPSSSPRPRGAPSGIGGIDWGTSTKSGSGGGGSKSKKDPTEELFRATEEQIAKLRLETSLLGQVSEQAASAKIEFDLLADAKRKGIEVTDSLKTRISEEADALARAQEAYSKAAKEMEFMTEVGDALKNGLSTAFSDIITGAESAEDALKQLAASLLSMVANQLIGNALSAGLSGLGFKMAAANGAAFDGGNVIPFARGGVVSAPTLFPMRGGTGLMGEAGPEAIMPLTRGADGKLGVRAAGGGAQQVHVTVGVDRESGNLIAFVDDRARPIAQQEAASAVGSYDRTGVRSRIQQYQRNPERQW